MSSGQPISKRILAIGYSNLERWSRKIMHECETVENVIRALSSEDAITTVNRRNVSFEVAAGGFEAVTNPAFVFTVRDSGRGAVSAEDVSVLNNALGYVLSQGGTVHFSPDDPDAYDFPLDYAVVSFPRNLTGLQAKAFFDYLGTIDPPCGAAHSQASRKSTIPCCSSSQIRPNANS